MCMYSLLEVCGSGLSPVFDSHEKCESVMISVRPAYRSYVAKTFSTLRFSQIM